MGEKEKNMKCVGCGEYRDPLKAAVFRPDGTGDIFALCNVCIEAVGRYWVKHFEPRPRQGELQRAWYELQAIDDH
jgi:hypothetical protein